VRAQAAERCREGERGAAELAEEARAAALAAKEYAARVAALAVAAPVPQQHHRQKVLWTY